ncbi:MAG TPA: hypothetical protein VJB93_04150 [Patescibacteria group bacterium]|nr:hypothetical protein [Patescibacteria group bacterium]
MKKIFIFILSFVFILGVTATAFAANPTTPVNQKPVADAVDQPIAIKLESNAFADTDGNETMIGSQWQVATESNGYGNPQKLVYDTGFVKNKNIVHQLRKRLAYGMVYFWHVRYQDKDGNWSDWSAESKFTTLTEADFGCVRSAVDKREAAFSTAQDAYFTAMKTALGARKTALTTSFAKTTIPEIRAEQKKAITAYKTARTIALTTLQKALKTARTQTVTDVKVCRSGAKVSDSSLESSAPVN